jgi:multiple sugar transport system permease protein
MCAWTLPAAHAALPPIGRGRARHDWVFTVPAGIVVVAGTVFPYILTFYRSVHDRKISGTVSFVGLANDAQVPPDDRFLEAIVRTLVFCAALMVLPVVLGIQAAVCFTGNFRGCGRVPSSCYR